MNSLSIMEQLKSEGHILRTTKGTSMNPMLYESKTVVDIRACSGDECKKHDIPLFIRSNGDFVLHRLIRRKGNMLYIRGDNLYLNEPVPVNAIIGVVTSFYRKGKWHDTESRKYRVYVTVWCISYPLRKLIHIGLSVMKHIIKKLFFKSNRKINDQ